MKTWKRLLEKQDNDAYDMYDNVEDVLDDWKFALIDLKNGDIYEVSHEKDSFESEIARGALHGYDIQEPAILDIENDVIYKPATNFVATKDFNIDIVDRDF
jgi:hypothetical protein